MNRKILLGAILAVFLLLMMPINSAVNINNNLNKEGVNESENSILSKNIHRNENYPIIIEQYEDGVLVNTIEKDITDTDDLKNLLEILKNNKLQKNIEELVDLDNENKKDTSLNIHLGNIEKKSDNGQTSDVFDFVEYNTPVEIIRAGIAPLSFGTTGLGYFSLSILLRTALFLTLLLNVTLTAFPALEPLINFTASILSIPIFIILSPFILSALAGLFRPLFLYRPLFFWIGGSALGGIKIRTREHEYVGSGFLEATLNGFTGIHLGFGFYNYLGGFVTRISASGEIVGE
jgi:hypothetical protein